VISGFTILVGTFWTHTRTQKHTNSVFFLFFFTRHGILSPGIVSLLKTRPNKTLFNALSLYI